MSTASLTLRLAARHAIESFGLLLTTFGLLLLARQLIFHIAVVTLGAPAAPAASALLSALAPDGLIPLYDLHICSAVLLLGSLPALLHFRSLRTPEAAMSIARLLVGFVVLVSSYRLLAVLAFVALAVQSLRPARAHTSPVASWLPLALVVALAFLPVDLSLQRMPGPPRFVPAISGLVSAGAVRDEAQGKFVIVGTCIPFFNEPSWVWVW